MPIDTDTETAFARAETERRSGNYKKALEEYLSILTKRLVILRECPSISKLIAADMVVIERAADLAVLFGHDQAADNLLAGMATALYAARNSFSADLITVKR